MVKARELITISPEGLGELDIQELMKACAKPPLWAQHECPFWDDEHIAKHMLEAHLNTTWDAASYRSETIEKIVQNLHSSMNLNRGMTLLDLGCGPGLYCSKFARLGLKVTGMDYSRNSIAYAKARAREANLDVEYVYQDYLTLNRTDEFDTATLIYLDFGVLSDDQRSVLLTRLHKALKPGGLFAFDVMTPFRKPVDEGRKDWQVVDSGFWSPTPHVVLTQDFAYQDAGVDLEQIVVLEDDGRIKIYRLWTQSYTRESITVLLNRHGFDVVTLWSDLTGKPYNSTSETLGILARRM